MSPGPAHIDSPEVIRDLRKQFAILDQTCRNAVMGCSSDANNTKEWLRNDQRLYWRQQLRKREEELVVASREYAQARWAAGDGGRSSGVEELRALERAKRRKEEAEQKSNMVKKWTALLEQQINKLIVPCNALTILLDQRTPKAMARLDQMLESLEEYFRQAPREAP